LQSKIVLLNEAQFSLPIEKKFNLGHFDEKLGNKINSTRCRK
jgi:hypothetical protein